MTQLPPDTRTRTNETHHPDAEISISPPVNCAPSRVAADPSPKPVDDPTQASQSYCQSTNDPERHDTNPTTINEKSQSPSSPASQSSNPYRVWPPWKREDGWRGWKNEWVRKDALVIPLIVQAFSAGVLDATTYADFQTFASNRQSHLSVSSESIIADADRNRKYNLTLR